VAASSTTVTSEALTGADNPAAQPDLRERRALTSAAFETPPPLRQAPVFRNERPIRDEAPFKTELLVKDEWVADDGLRLKGAMVAYKSRF
jgi:hypothetical protein